MARGMSFRIHDPSGREVARVRDSSSAAVIVAANGERASVRDTGGSILWLYGVDVADDANGAAALIAARKASA